MAPVSVHHYTQEGRSATMAREISVGAGLCPAPRPPPGTDVGAQEDHRACYLEGAESDAGRKREVDATCEDERGGWVANGRVECDLRGGKRELGRGVKRRLRPEKLEEVAGSQIREPSAT